MADVSSLSMVSSYNSLAMYRQQQQSAVSQQSALAQQQQHQHPQGQQHPGAGSDGQQYWYGYPYAHPHAAHHQASGAQQYLEPADVLGWPPHPHAHAHPHYSHHLQYQHHQASYQQQQQAQHPAIPNGFGDWSGDETKNGVGAGEPSPPITVSGSEISSPGTPTTPPANNNNNVATTPVNRPSQIRSPFEWMKKPSYQSQPNPACSVAAPTTTSLSSATPHELCSLDALGKTRTKDKYRVVYTDHQRLELEKEFHYSRYITIRRKAELAANLALSERQVKIWFQNRRAKERKQTKKREELDQKDPKVEGGLSNGGMAGLAALGGMGGMLGGLTSLSLAAPPPPLHPHPHPHPHGHPHPHPHTVLGL